MCNTNNVFAIGNVKKLVIACANTNNGAVLPDSDGILPDHQAINPVDVRRVIEIGGSRDKYQGDEGDNDKERKLPIFGIDNNNSQKSEEKRNPGLTPDGHNDANAKDGGEHSPDDARSPGDGIERPAKGNAGEKYQHRAQSAGDLAKNLWPPDTQNHFFRVEAQWRSKNGSQRIQRADDHVRYQYPANVPRGMNHPRHHHQEEWQADKDHDFCGVHHP